MSSLTSSWDLHDVDKVSSKGQTEQCEQGRHEHGDRSVGEDAGEKEVVEHHNEGVLDQDEEIPEEPRRAQTQCDHEVDDDRQHDVRNDAERDNVEDCTRQEPRLRRVELASSLAEEQRALLDEVIERRQGGEGDKSPEEEERSDAVLESSDRKVDL